MKKERLLLSLGIIIVAASIAVAAVIFSDTFTRSNGAPANNWTSAVAASSVHGWDQLGYIYSNELVYSSYGESAVIGGTYSQVNTYRNAESYPTSSAVQVSFDFWWSRYWIIDGGAWTSSYGYGINQSATTGILYFMIGSSHAYDNGIGIKIDCVAGKYYTYINGTGSNETAVTITETPASNRTNTKYKVKAIINGTSIKMKLWAASGIEPAAYTEFTIAANANTGTYFQVQSYVAGGGGGGAYQQSPMVIWFDDLVLQTPEGGSSGIDFKTKNIENKNMVVK